MKVLLAGFLFALGVQSAGAATLAAIDVTDTSQYVSATKLFTSEIKRDENLQDNGQRGHDAFLRNGELFTTPASYNFDWGSSGTSYDWALAYDGDKARLTFGGTVKTLDIDPDGTWNAVRFFINASDTGRFLTSTALVKVETANGAALSSALILSATDGLFDGTFALAGLGQITSLSGTLAFSFTTKQGAVGSPNGRLGINVKALDVVPATVPLPAALPLLLAGVGALGLAARRRRAG